MSKTDKKPRILIVDDAPENIKMLSKLLEKDYQVLAETNGSDALKVAMNDEIDLILLDIVMPGIDGFEVCEKLKATDETRGIPVVFITGEANTESVVSGLEAGAYYYLTKERALIGNLTWLSIPSSCSTLMDAVLPWPKI